MYPGPIYALARVRAGSRSRVLALPPKAHRGRSGHAKSALRIIAAASIFDRVPSEAHPYVSIGTGLLFLLARGCRHVYLRLELWYQPSSSPSLIRTHAPQAPGLMESRIDMIRTRLEEGDNMMEIAAELGVARRTVERDMVCLGRNLIQQSKTWQFITALMVAMSSPKPLSLGGLTHYPPGCEWPQLVV